MTDTLAVVGAGPKALAVAAKAFTLRELGLPAPRVVAVDTHGVAGNWLPAGGWTDGNQRLGTSPEKDIGFPYRCTLAPGRNQAVDTKMLSYSWTTYLVEHGGYAEWVDRGRPHPHHREWARYLQWVARAIELEVVIGTVESVSAGAGRWQLRLAGSDNAPGEIESDSLMFTGPGHSREALLRHHRVLSIAEFWDLASRRQLPAASRVAVIGGGETAGSALETLGDGRFAGFAPGIHNDIMTISAISPMATLYTRGESYFENALFSDPSKWNTLTGEERRDVIRRTDRGVMSVRVQESLVGDNRIHHLQGRVVRARAQDDLVALTLRNDSRPEQTLTFDLVIDATGGRPLWFLDLLDSDAADQLELAVGWPVTQERLEAAIGHNLAVTRLEPTLYLPNLAAMAQGPGFPNLSCLGALSDRILTPVRSPRPHRATLQVQGT